MSRCIGACSLVQKLARKVRGATVAHGTCVNFLIEVVLGLVSRLSTLVLGTIPVDF